MAEKYVCRPLMFRSLDCNFSVCTVALRAGLNGKLKVCLWHLLFPVKGTATREYLTAYDRIFAFCNFSSNLCNQALQEHWATLELLKTLHETITSLQPLPRKLQLYSYSQKKCILRNFVCYKFCWRLSFQPLEEDSATSGLFNVLNGTNIRNLWPIYAAITEYFKKSILRSFAFYNLCWILDFQPLEEDWAISGLLNTLNGVNIANPSPMAYSKIVFCEIWHFTAFARDLIFSF